jgi:hypothetical protein
MHSHTHRHARVEDCTIWIWGGRHQEASLLTDTRVEWENNECLKNASREARAAVRKLASIAKIWCSDRARDYDFNVLLHSTTCMVHVRTVKLQSLRAEGGDAPHSNYRYSLYK